jgi:hypothetical protein
MKLGLVVVYLVKPDHGGLLDLHLRQIAACTTVPYTIHRLAAAFHQRLLREPHLQLHDFPATAARDGDEHAYYLEQLTRAALADGATHVAVLHVDSFPIRRGWAEDLASRCTSANPLCAIHLRECGDQLLTCSALLFFTRQFHEQYQPVFHPSPELRASADFQAFVAGGNAGEIHESGIAYAYTLHRHGLSWTRLQRSNRHNDHFLLAGIYGDCVFHLGAAARPTKGLRGDRDHRGLLGLARQGWSRLYPWLPAWLQHAFRKLARQRPSVTNQAIYERLRQRLLADPAAYLAHLRGQADSD